MSRVVIPGGSGYLGRHLAQRLRARGDEVVVLTRGASQVRHGIRHVHWDGDTLGPWKDELDGTRAVVHLAGRRVDCRPTRRNIDELTHSRVQSVRVVGEAIRGCDRPPEVWVQLSTMAIYGDAGDQLIDERVPPSGLGPRQMVGVALAWEAAFHQAAATVDRQVLLRAGIAIGGAGDPATARLAQLARMRLAGPVGGGRQWVSWLAVEDLLRIIERGIDDDRMAGLYLATGPTPATNAQLMAAYREALGVHIGIPSPRAMTELGAWALGSDPKLALTGRRGVPRRLLDEGFRFRGDDLHTTVAAALTPRGALGAAASAAAWE